MTTPRTTKAACRKGTCKSFDVDFAHCNCEGTKHKMTGMQVISVKWKRTDNNPHGRVRFQCQRCKQTWSMGNVRGKGSGLMIDASHPEEVARRRAIPYFNETVAVNLGGQQSTGSFPGAHVGSQTSRRGGHL